MAEFTIMWYNILHGFHKQINTDKTKKIREFVFQPERLEAVKKIVAELNPDILVFGEADFNPLNTYGGKETKKIDYGQEFNYTFASYTAVTERKGEVILSKSPFSAESLSSEMFSHMKANFEINSKNISISIIHPHPTIPEKEKAEKIIPILDKMKSPCILLGDFNALSPEDKYSVEELTEGFKPGREEGAKDNALDVLQFLMVKQVLNMGLIDAYRAKNKDRGDTIPTKSFSPFKEHFGDMRLDYIFCSKDFKIIECKCIKNELTDMASDHYPLFARIGI